MRALRSRVAIVSAAALVAIGSIGGCKKKVGQRECDALLDRYASLVVTEKMIDASAEAVQAEQRREREAARMDDNFKSCATQLTEEEYRCAMSAKSADAIEKCLE